MLTDSYKEIAAFYDEFVGVDQYEHYVRKKNWLIVALAVFGYKKEDGAFLDLGCGTGINCVYLAEDGYTVTGVDISESMLEVAREKSRAKGLDIAFIQQDIAELSLSRNFACIFSRETLTHLLEREQLVRVFRHCWDHLQPGGLLLFEICTAFALKLQCIKESLSFKKFIWAHAGRFQESDSSALIDYTFTFHDGRKVVTSVAFKAHTPEELSGMLRETGFRDVRLFDTAINPEIVNGGMTNRVQLRPVLPTVKAIQGGMRGILCGARKP